MSDSSLSLGASLALIGIFGAVAVGGAMIKASGCEDITFKFNRYENNSTSDGHKYLIFTEGEVFENTDSWLQGKFNSSDVQNTNMQAGQFYSAKVCGVRMPVLSWYRNVVSIPQPASKPA